MNYLKITVIALVFATAAAVNASGQNPPPKDGHHAAAMKEAREDFLANKVAFFTNALNLTPQEAQVFWPLYNEFWEKRVQARREFMRILNRVNSPELKEKEDVVEGTITIGCGEFAAVETLAKICKTYKEKYPLVQIVLHTATADAVYEMMNKGLVDIALFMEPVDTEGLDYIRITDCDHWCVGMRPDDPLAEKEFIRKEDLIGKPLILPERVNVQSELASLYDILGVKQQ